MIVILVVLLVLAVAAAVGLGMRLSRANTELAVERERVVMSQSNAQKRIDDMQRDCDRRIEQARSDMSNSFRAIAAETLEATVRRQHEQADSELKAVLNPVREAFERLSGSMERRALDDRAERTMLRDGIEALRRLNTQVCDEAKRLSTALRGNTGVQGRWGEMVLENILEGSGLERSRWVTYQASTTTEDGERLRPDAVIHCPRKREIIIDSKVSLTAYLRYTEATDDTRSALLADHVRSIENHLRQLSAKDYQHHVGATDAGFVLMFIPHEGAYLAAMQANPDLWQRAYDRHVVLVSPTHLVTVIRLVEQMWQTEDQTANTLAIADEASKMLDVLNEFVADMNAIDAAIKKAETAYNAAVRHLSEGRGNVMRRAENLRKLGVRTRKAATPLAGATPDEIDKLN